MKSELLRFPVFPNVVKYLLTFPEDGALYHSIVCIGQFSKKVKANPVKDKDTLALAYWLLWMFWKQDKQTINS